jgi:lipoprotein-anchoring transpeptidase ErfK/SrfK
MKIWFYLKYIFFTSLAIGLGIFIAFLATKMIGAAYAQIFNQNETTSSLGVPKEDLVSPMSVVPSAKEEKILPTKINFGNISDNEFKPPADGKMIRANLKTMEIRLYENGSLIDSIPISEIGREGTYRETPGGQYKILFKEKNHFSSIGKVWMPYSMQFFGNYFIHGWPYYPDGQPVSSAFSGGCIRLKDKDAKEIYAWSDLNTAVSIFSGDDIIPENNGDSFYFIKDGMQELKVDAESYLVGDLDTGEIILQKNEREILPIASLTKLITALTSLEIISPLAKIPISKKAVSTYGESGDLVIGEKLRFLDILHPLLLESSNDAGEAIAEYYGHEDFIQKMNEKIGAIKLENTIITDPTGISENNRSTATDLFRLITYIKKYKSYILEILKEKSYQISGHNWVNNSQFMNEDGFLGSKSGYTNAAGETAIALFNIHLSEFGDSRNIAIIALKSPDRFGDVEKILRYLKYNVYYGQEN